MSSWTLALRIARREALRHKGRSLLVATMIALPVAGAGAADTLWRSSQVTGAEHAVREMGRYDALVQPSSGSALLQTPDGQATWSPPHGGPAGTPPTLASLLPAGSSISTKSGYNGMAWAIEGHSRTYAELEEVDLSDPLTRGMTINASGTAPTAADEVAVSGDLVRRLGKHIGDTIAVQVDNQDGTAVAGAPAQKSYRITEVFDDPSDTTADLVIGAPGKLIPAGVVSTQNLVAVPGGVSWDMVQKLNAQGFTVTSKQVLTSPPPDSAVPFYQQNPKISAGLSASRAVAYAVATIAASMVLLEIILLAGPAFAVSARRRRRDFGLLGAAGADGKRLRRIVLADGVVLGALGAVLGVAGGIAGSAIGLPYLTDVTNQQPGGFRIAPLELLATALMGLVTGVIAALAPAISTARQDVLNALTGRRGTVTARWKLPVAGAVAIGIGILVMCLGAFHDGSSNPLPVAGGIAIAELGVVACTPILVAWSGRLARFLPTTGRLALRDGARNRGRTAPAVAAIMAAVAGASAVAMIIATGDATSRAQYLSTMRMGEAGISLQNSSGIDAQQVAAKIGAALPTRQSAVVSGEDYRSNLMPQVVRLPANACPLGPDGPMSAADMQRQRTDPRCRQSDPTNSQLPTSDFTEGGPTALRAMTGTTDPAAEQVLGQGGIVVFSPYDLTTPAPHATVTVAVRDWSCPLPGEKGTTGAFEGPPQPDCSATKTTVLPAVLSDHPQPAMTALVAPGALEKIGAKFVPQAILFDTARMPTAAEQQKANDIAGDLGLINPVVVERGYQSNTYIGLIALAAVAAIVTLGAAAVATGLAITDAQNDLETLAAVGARPRVRRTLAGAQAAVIAGLGAVLGSAFGLVPAVGLVEARVHGLAQASILTSRIDPSDSGGVQLTVPWLFLGITIAVVPALAALGAALFTRSRIELRRRRA